MEKKPIQSAAVILIAILGLLGAYPLSIGPAIATYDAMDEPQFLGDFIETAYSPLADLPEPLGSWLESYISLWDR
jgi:hypothetical protein